MKVIVPLNFATVAELKTALNQLDERVDVAELWLDRIYEEFLANPMLALEIQGVINNIKQRLGIAFLAVCKQPQEQGHFPGNAHERVQLLAQFLKLGGNYIDLDVHQNPAEVIAQIPKSQCWLSFHDFESADLDIIQAQYETMKIFDPVLYKFAATPKNEDELKAFIDFAARFEDTGIFTTMGPLGSEGRDALKTLTWGGFYALNEESKTASGQPTLENL